MYENIDMERTGILLKEMFDKSGYTVKDTIFTFRHKQIFHMNLEQSAQYIQMIY